MLRDDFREWALWLHLQCAGTEPPGALLMAAAGREPPQRSRGCGTPHFLSTLSQTIRELKARLGVVSQRDMAVAAAVQGVGLAFRGEELLRPLIDEGKLVLLLEEWCGTFPGWYLCYPKQRHMLPTVRGFVDFLRRSTGPRPTADRARQ
jgi:DNA-binding transcriptional LysR family regulator